MFKVIEVLTYDKPTHWNICYGDCTEPHVTVWSNEISAQMICDYLNSGK